MEEQVLDILKKNLGIDSIDETISRQNCVKWDSLAHINIIIELESTFNITLKSDDIGKIQSYEDIVSILKDRTNKNNSIEIRTIWSDVISPSEIEDFRYVVNTVFDPFCTMEYFHRKYFENIYGPSLIYIAYLDAKPVGAFALWRNDVGGRKAYCQAETCILDSCSVPGLFASIIRLKSIFATENNAMIFSFPNGNSFPGYKGMGWDITPFYKCPLFYRFRYFAIPLLFFRSVPKINKEHALWWLQFRIRKGVCRYKLLGRYYLVKRGSKKRVCVLGRVDKDTAMAFPKLEQPYGVWFFYTPKAGLFGKRFGYINGISYNTKNVDYEYWETDAV